LRLQGINNASQSLLDEDQLQRGLGESDSIQNNLLPLQITPESFKNSNEIKIFENDSLTLTLQKCKHKKATKFSLLDSLFQVQISPKANSKDPLYFKDLLDILDNALKHIMKNLQSYFPENPNALSFLTLYQDGMVNGLSTGGYSLSEEPDELVNKLMQILFNFLLSDENLTVNNGFKVYVDVYSKDHSQKAAQKSKNIYKGRKAKSLCATNSYWSLEPSSEQLENHPFLADKCLLIAIALGHFQNLYYETKSDAANDGILDSKFMYAQGIGSSNPFKQQLGMKIITNEVTSFFDYLNERKVTDVTNLDLVAPIANDAYACQLVIFSGLNNQIKYMFPKTFDETLRPIYLFHPSDETNHIVFIRHVNAFFRAMKQVTCVYCRKSFVKISPRHICTVRRNCLACRRFFCQQHKVPSKIHAENYCSGDKSFKKFVKECEVCNLKLLTESCALIHKGLCGKGFLGFKCKHCNKYFHRNQKFKNPTEFLKHHICGQKLCPTCKVYVLESNHICEIKKFYFTDDIKSLAFLSMEFLHEANSCITPNVITIMKEIGPFKGKFDLYQISDFHEDFEVEEQVYDFSYVDQILPVNFPTKLSKELAAEFESKILKVQTSVPQSCLEKFIKFLVSNLTETIIICRDEEGYIFDALIKGILRANINLNILSRSKKYFTVEIQELKIKIVNISNYLPGSEDEIAKLSKTAYAARFFPQRFNLQENYSYEGHIPEIQYFESKFESKEILKQKMAYVENFNQLWVFKKEIKLFSRQKAYLMCASTCLFLKELVLLQQKIHSVVKTTNLNKEKLLWPFSNKICTFSGFIYSLFRGLFLNDENIYCIQNEYHVPSRKVSQSEYQFCKYLEFKFPQLELIHNFSNKEGQKFFKESVPDIYIPSLKCAIFFNGCYFHGHFRDSEVISASSSSNTSSSFNEITDECPDQTTCTLSRAAKSTTMNKKMNKTYLSLQEEFNSKVADLIANNPSKIESVKVFWECFYKKCISKTTLHDSFMKDFKSHPLKRLTPRDCSLGGLLQSFAYLWNQKEFSSETFYCCDINGLYSHVAMSESYNVGKYEVILGKQLKQVAIKSNKFYYGKKKLFGTALVTILPPKSLFCPFLLFKDNNNKSVLILCRKCYLKNMKKCYHSDADRQFFGSYFIEELEFALSLGYQVTAIHECHAYFEQQPILKKFITILNYNKIKHSSYLDGKSQQEKQSYCNYLNEKMNFREPFLLNPDDESDQFRKHLFKMASNSLFGKLQQRKDKINTHMITDDDDLNSFILEHSKEIQSIQCFEDRICQVSVKPKQSEIKNSIETNCYLGSQIVANARIFFYKQIQKVLESKGKLFYIDTDCIFFSISKNSKNPLTMSDATGDFKHVYQNVSDFYCLGPKNYIVAFVENGQIKTSTKVRGLNLNAHFVENILEPNTYRDYLLSFLLKETKIMKIPQSRTRSHKNIPFSRKTKLETVTFSNKINYCRYLNKKSPILSTLPFGYE